MRSVLKSHKRMSAAIQLKNIRNLNLAVVRRMTVQAIKLVLQPELFLIGQDLLYRAWTKRCLVCVLYIYEL
jgi:hypothetical protein